MGTPSFCARRVPLFLVAFLSLTAVQASADGIVIDAFLTPQTVVAPGCQTVNGQCLVPEQTTYSSVVTGVDILGGTREMTVTRASTGAPFAFTVTGSVANGSARLVPLIIGSMLLEWDANGAGLDLDLSEMMGLSFSGGTSDGNPNAIFRLISSDGNMFVLSQNLDENVPFPKNPHIRTYAFDLFQQIGQPDLHDIYAIQIEFPGFHCCGSSIWNLSFAPQAVPDGTSTITLLWFGVLTILVVQYRQG